MPRYDYRCTSCDNEFELVQTFAEAGSGACPACSGAGQRVYHAVPVIYKGSGFYTTDYGRPKAPAENKNGSSDSSSSSSSDSSDSKTSGDSKSETAEKSTNDSTAKSSTVSNSAPSTTASST
ncbi:MAG: hypothetical protein BZY87_06515 [SAR202 cluster bacterium Io17-Chloro-G6]|nr:MAG: hypothetical protein BZY87_06515 [SAR202 cluster bacterium Io17-Chloro-G6]